jgi:hypothetical protein
LILLDCIFEKNRLFTQSRYALDSPDGDPQFWRLLGIQPILFPQSHKSDYNELYDGVHHLADHVRRGILDWQREVTALAESGPPMDEASVGLIEQGLQEVATTRFFVQAARAQEWIGWIEKRGVFDALFDTPTLSERSNLLAQWLAEYYALQYPSEIFLLIGRHNLRLNATFWWALASQVSRDEPPIDADTYARLVSLLLATAPQNANAHLLNGLAERGAKLGRVDELFDDNPHGDEMNQSQKGLAQFLIPCGNASKLLEVVEEPFHLLTSLVEVFLRV